MATPWAFEEDFIVCEFYFEHLDDNWRLYVDELMQRLAKSGFNKRALGSATMRVQNYEFLHTKTTGLSRAANQTRCVYESFSKLYARGIIKGCYSGRISSGSSATYTIPESIFEADKISDPVLSYLSVEAVKIYNSMVGSDTKATFWKILCKFIDQRGFKKDSDVYRPCFVGRDVFANLRAGKGVSKKTIFQLCFGLKLNADEAVVLLASAGYAFETNKNPDDIVLRYLKEQNHDIFGANIELYELNAPRLF
jgi:hypothetical protein